MWFHKRRKPVYKEKKYKKRNYIFEAICYYIVFTAPVFIYNNYCQFKTTPTKNNLVIDSSSDANFNQDNKTDIKNNTDNTCDKKSGRDLDNIVMYYLTAIIFGYDMLKYIRNKSRKEIRETNPYRPIYLVEKIYYKRNNKQRVKKIKKVKITALFSDNNIIIRNVHIYTLNINDKLGNCNVVEIVNCNKTFYENEFRNGLFIVADTLNRERIFTLVTEDAIINAIENTSYLNFYINDLILQSQDPIYESHFNNLKERLKNIIESSHYYK